jgi:hypothetical protein
MDNAFMAIPLEEKNLKYGLINMSLLFLTVHLVGAFYNDGSKL